MAPSTSNHSLGNVLFFQILVCIFTEGQSCGNVCQLLNEELEKCDIWIKANKLTLNLKKTHFMIFHRSRIKSEGVQITIRNENIKKNSNCSGRTRQHSRIDCVCLLRSDQYNNTQ